MKQIAKAVSGVTLSLRAIALSFFAALFTMATLAMVPTSASAQATGYVASAQTGINQAKDDALTVGGYVIAAVAILIGIAWILSMVKKR